VKSIWLRVGGRYAITLRAWLLLLPVAVFGTPGFVPEGLVQDSSIWMGFLVGLIGHVVTGLFLLPAYFSYLSPGSNRPPRPLAAIATLALAGLARGFSVAFSFEYFGLVESSDYLPRMIAGAIIVTIWFAVTAVLVGARQQYVQVYSRLAESLEQAKALASAGATEVAKTRAELVAQVKRTLNEAFSSRSSTVELHNLADDVIRPLSHSLASHQPVIVSPTVPKRRIRFGPVLSTALYEFPFNPIAVATIGLISTLYSKVWNIGLTGFLETVIQALVIVLLFSAAKRLGVRGWLVPLVWLATSFIANLSSWLILQYDLTNSIVTALLLSISIVLPAGFVSMLLAYDQQAALKLDELRQALEDVNWQERKLNQQLWIEKRRLARYVHSDIQGRVRAAALSSTAGTVADVTKLQKDCISALDISREVPPFERFYADTVELWEGVAKISLVADRQALELISTDSFGLASAVEVIREGIGNAVKHGSAKNIEILLQVVDSPNPCLEVIVLDDGSKKPDAAVSGFGTQTISEVSSSWGLEQEAGKTKLWAKVPVSTS
jgi:hypothetical protein